MEDTQHAAVIRKHVSREGHNAVFARDAHEAAQQKRADALALKIVVHGEGDFGVVAGGVAEIATHADHPLAAFMRDESDKREVVSIVHRYEFLDLFVWQMPDVREITMQNRLLGMRIEEFLQQRFVRGLDGAELNA